MIAVVDASPLFYLVLIGDINLLPQLFSRVVAPHAAILLAESIQADILIIDEKAARLIAGQRGISVTGTLGIVGEAAERGLVDLKRAIDRLRRTSFRRSPALFKATSERYGTRTG